MVSTSASEAIALTWYDSCGGWMSYSHFVGGKKVREFSFELERADMGARRLIVNTGEREPWEATQSEIDALALGALIAYSGIPGIDIVADRNRPNSGAAPVFRKDLPVKKTKQTKVQELNAQEGLRRKRTDKFQQLVEAEIEKSKLNGRLTDDDPMRFFAWLMRRGKKK